MKYITKKQIKELEDLRQQCIEALEHGKLTKFFNCASGRLEDCYFPFLPKIYQTDKYVYWYNRIKCRYLLLLENKQPCTLVGIPFVIENLIEDYLKQQLLSQVTLAEFVNTLNKSTLKRNVPDYILDKLNNFVKG